MMMVEFYEGAPVTISDERGNRLKQVLLNRDVRFVDINDTMYAAASIKKISPTVAPTKQTTPLLPDIPVPDDIKEAYDKRTISIQEAKQKFINRKRIDK